MSFASEREELRALATAGLIANQTTDKPPQWSSKESHVSGGVESRTRPPEISVQRQGHVQLDTSIQGLSNYQHPFDSGLERRSSVSKQDLKGVAIDASNQQGVFFQRLQDRGPSPDSYNSVRPAESPSQESEADRLRRTHRVCSGYLKGQLCNVAKAAVWWSTFGVLVEALTMVPLAVGSTRLVFNFALVLTSPLAGALAEKASIRFFLYITTVGRLLVWFVLVTTSWIVLENYLDDSGAFFITFLCLMFADGMQVSFANVVDIDCGGLDTLAMQYGLTIGDYLRNRFNSIHQIIFDLSFILLTPPVACMIWRIAIKVESVKALNHPNSFIKDIDVVVLVFGICGVFCLLSLYSLWCYWSGLKDAVPEAPPTGEVTSWMDDLRATRDRLLDVKHGFLIVIRERALGWRLLFLACETALEDAMVSVVIPQIAINLTPLLSFASQYSRPNGQISWTLVNLVAVCIIAVGKSGGLLAGGLMNTRWTAPVAMHRGGPYTKLFWCVLLSSASVLVFPASSVFLSTYRGTHPAMATAVASTLILSAAFLFFVFSTAPKIGFATLLQNLVVNPDIATKVFGFVGTFVTIADALVIFGINFIFAECGPARIHLALTAVSGIYLFHGAFEALLGPRLILDAEDDSLQVYPAASSRDFPNLYASTGSPLSSDQFVRT